jgi:hypothetical protein
MAPRSYGSRLGSAPPLGNLQAFAISAASSRGGCTRTGSSKDQRFDGICSRLFVFSSLETVARFSQQHVLNALSSALPW